MAALTAGMDSQESVEWLASLQLDPPEEDRADVRHAMLMSMLAQVYTGKPHKPQAFLDDLPWRDVATAPKTTPALLRRKIDAAMMAFGGKR